MSARTSYLLDGERVARARVALPVGEDGRQVSQDDLGGLVGIHRVTVTRIENGKAPVSLEVLERLSQVLGVSRSWLLGEPEQVDELERAREKMARSLAEFSDAVDLLAGRLQTAAPASPVERAEAAA